MNRNRYKVIIRLTETRYTEVGSLKEVAKWITAMQPSNNRTYMVVEDIKEIKGDE